MTSKFIPRYFVYGEPARRLDTGFIHVENISDRKNLHRGKVEAHSHPNMNQLTVWTKGGGTYKIEDQTWIFSAPAVCWIPAGVVHGFSVSPYSDATVLSLADGAINDLPKAAASLYPARRKDPDVQELQTLLAMIKRQQATQNHDVLLDLAGLALRFAERLMNAGEPTLTMRPLAARLKLLIDQRFRKPLKIADIVKALNTTNHLVDRAARQSFGLPIKKLILERRMLEAKRLLKFTIRPAEDIAFELGFDDPAYFNRSFKKHTGTSPIAWRKQN